MQALLLSWVVVVLSFTPPAFAEHEGGEGAEGRPAFSSSCTIYPTGQQRHYTTFAPGALSPKGDNAFVVSNSDVPTLESASGTEKNLNLDGRILSSGFSGDGQKLFTAVAGRGIKLWEGSSGKAIGEALHDGVVTIAKFSPDSRAIVSASTDGAYRVTDAITGKSVYRSKHGKPLTSAEFSADGKFLVTASRDNKVHVVDIQSGESKTFSHAAEVNGASLSPDGTFLITGGRDNVGKIINLTTGEEKIVKHDEWVKGGAISPDNRYAVTASSDGTAKVIDIATGEEVHRVRHKQEVSKVKFSADGKFLVTASLDGSAKIVEVPSWRETGTLRHTDRINDIALSADGRMVATASRDGMAKVADLASGREVAAVKHGGFMEKVDFSADGKKLLSTSNRKLVVTDLDPVCIEENMKFIRAKREDDGKNVHDEILQELCPKEFKAEDWKDYTPSFKGKTLPSALAKNFLYRFQKPGGFEAKEHTSYLVTILKSDMPQREPALVAGALQTIAMTSPQLYDALFQRIPDLRKLIVDPSVPQVCRTKKDEEKVLNGGKAYLKSLLHKHELSPTRLEDWAGLGPLKGQLAKLSESEKDSYMGDISESLEYGASLNPQLSDVFHSKLYYYSEEAVKPFFGLEREPTRTEVATVRERDKIRVMLMGSHPIDGDPATSTPHGFYVKNLGEIPLRENLPTGALDMKALGFNPEVEWSHAGKKYKANLTGEVLSSIAEIIPKGKSYPYDELWKNDKLTGLVFTGSNLREESAGALEAYLGFYQERGYEFGEKQAVPDLRKFMKEKISSGEVDYLLKEAHSGGDEKNLVEIDKTADMIVGTKTLPNGKKEEIYLVYPKPGKQKSIFIGNDEFGTWVREREKEDRPSLVYFNASCWSCQKALYEIEAAHSPKLVDIATTTLAYVFRNRKNHPQRMVMDAFLNGKNYDETRQALSEDPGYKARVHDVYIFPDEEDYRTKIIDKLKVPVVMDVKMTDENGKPHFPGKPDESQ